MEAEENIAAADEPPPDPFDFAEPVAVLSRLPPGFYASLTSTKWKDRKEALEPLLSLLQAPRFASDSYDELVRALAGRMADANVVVVGLAANCIERLALGLRTAFAGYRTVAVGPMLARTKEKKASVLDAIGAALDAVFTTVRASYLKLKPPDA
jgi:cytoskeleton-associated protein 5